MSIVTHTDRVNLVQVVYDNESTAPVNRYAIFYEGMNTVVSASPLESPAAVWQRVLELVADMRAVIRRGAWRGREHMPATVYAIEPTEQQQNEHMRDYISFCLYQLSEPAHNKDDDARVQALIALSDLHGLAAPRVLTLPTLDGVVAEIARRKALR